jgi:hypothetical protein
MRPQGYLRSRLDHAAEANVTEAGNQREKTEGTKGRGFGGRVGGTKARGRFGVLLRPCRTARRHGARLPDTRTDCQDGHRQAAEPKVELALKVVVSVAVAGAADNPKRCRRRGNGKHAVRKPGGRAGGSRARPGEVCVAPSLCGAAALRSQLRHSACTHRTGGASHVLESQIGRR